MAIVNEVVTKFSFLGSIKKLSDYNKSLNFSIKRLSIYSSAALAAATATFAFVTSTNRSMDSMIQLSDMTNVSIKSLQELQFAASQSGSSAEAMSATIQGLTKTIGAAAERGNDDFARLGISIINSTGHLKSADKVLFEIQDRFKRLNLTIPEQMNFASRLGVDPSLIKLLGKSTSEIRRLREEARRFGIVSDKQAKQVDKYNDTIEKLHFQFKLLRNQVSIALTPAIQQLVSSFSTFLEKNAPEIIKVVGQMSEIFTSFAKIIKPYAPIIVGVAASFGTLKVASIGLRLAVRLLSKGFFLLFSRFNLITLGITGVIALFQDFNSAVNNGKSAIVDFGKSLFGIDFRPALKNIASGFSSFSKSIQASSNLIKASLSPKNIKQSFLKKISSLSNLFNPNISAFPSVLPSFPGTLGGLPVFGQSQSSANTNNTVNQEVNITVNSNDPVETGVEIRNTLNNQLRNANNQFSVGGS